MQNDANNANACTSIGGDDMKCIRCHKELTTDGRFCPYCGAVQQRKQGVRQRGNGTGTAYKQGQTWTARVTLGWRLDENGKPKRISRIKRGFPTKKAALEAVATLKGKRKYTQRLITTGSCIQRMMY